MTPSGGEAGKATVDNLTPPAATNAPANSQPVGGTAATGIKSDGGDDVIKLSSTLVSIPFLASDRTGHYLPWLTQKDFRLYEDGVEQKVAFFSSDRVAFHVAIVIDTSGSTTSNEKSIKSAANAFVRQLEQDDQVMVVSFAGQVNFETGFTNDRTLLNSAINKIKWGGSTKLYDAIYETITQKMKRVQGRKAIVLLTDGMDTSSNRASEQEAIDAAVESDSLVYVVRYPPDEGGYGQGGYGRPGGRRRGGITFPFPFSSSANLLTPQFGGQYPGQGGGQGRGRWGGEREDPAFLDKLINQSGGEIYPATKYTDIDGLLGKVIEGLRHVYVLGFYPTNPKRDGLFHKIRLEVTGNDEVALKYKHGYTASAQQTASQ